MSTRGHYPVAIGGGTLHVNFGPGPVVEVSRKPVGVKWCFGCRKRLEYEFVVKRYDVDPRDDPYGPWGAYECTRCHEDRALFPGRERVWSS